MIPQEFTQALRERLAQPLPGLAAQVRMAPLSRQQQLARFSVPDNARRSAVLIAFYPGEQGIQFPLILRNDYKGVHSGQIGLPGGQWEENDGDLLGTALREAEEEVGVHPSQVEILGRLSELYIPPSNFLVQPYLGVLPARPNFIPDPTEVAQLIEARLDRVRDSKYYQKSKIKHRTGVEMEVPSFNVQGHIVWGATAMMLSELLQILDELT
ncbi:MAG: CoA pyrophosphatase [Bacteroidota bacterium]